MALLSDLRYETAQDVQMRLNNTVVMYCGRPVYVGQNLHTQMTGANDLTLDVYDIMQGKYIDKVHSSDEDLEVKAQLLGYMNEHKYAVFVCRMPARRQRQGLSRDNTYVYFGDTPLPNHYRPAGDGNGVCKINADTLMSKDLGRMLLGEYPDFAEALKLLTAKKSDYNSVAFGRKLFIKRDEVDQIKLGFFTTVIGVFNRKKDTFYLPDRFAHYLPIMRNHGVPVSLED